MVSGEVELAVLGATMLVLRRMYVGVKRVAALGGGGGIEVVGKAIVAIEVVCILVMAEVYGLEAVSEVSEVSEV